MCSVIVEPGFGVVIVTGLVLAEAIAAASTVSAVARTNALAVFAFAVMTLPSPGYRETTQPFPVASNASLLHNG